MIQGIIKNALPLSTGGNTSVPHLDAPAPQSALGEVTSQSGGKAETNVSEKEYFPFAIMHVAPDAFVRGCALAQ
jgi:hypothetical protein